MTTAAQQIIINAIARTSPFGPDYKHEDFVRMADAILEAQAQIGSGRQLQIAIMRRLKGCGRLAPLLGGHHDRIDGDEIPPEGKLPFVSVISPESRVNTVEGTEDHTFKVKLFARELHEALTILHQVVETLDRRHDLIDMDNHELSRIIWVASDTERPKARPYKVAILTFKAQTVPVVRV